MAQPSSVVLPAHLTAPIKPVRADVLPPICRTCHNRRKVSDPFNSGIKMPCPACC
jgi:hypothetical protein